jgi:hypothetical protein
MNNKNLYLLLLAIIGFSACDLFETTIEEDRSSFFKIYPTSNPSYDAIRGDYVINTKDGFLLGGSFSPQQSLSRSAYIQVSHEGALKERKNLDNIITQYIKIIPGSNQNDYYFLGDNSLNTHAYAFKMPLNDINAIKSYKFGEQPNRSSIDFSLLPNDNLIVLTQNKFNFPSSLELSYLDADLNLIWERKFGFENASFIGLSVLHDAASGNFTVLAKTGSNQLLMMKVNMDGNLLNTRFFEEFSFQPVTTNSANSPESIYKPVLLDMETHYLVVETGRSYTKSDNSPYSSIYRIDKELTAISRLETDTKFRIVNTVQKLDNEVVINGFLDDSTFAIKKLNSEGEILNWGNGKSFVTFDMDLETLGDGEIFGASPQLGLYNDFFLPGNIVKTPDGGYAMIGTYGIFNGEDFETVMTLFKFRSDGSY